MNGEEGIAYSRSTDGTAAVTRFDVVEGEITYLSRTDGFANYAEATAAPTSYSMPEEYKAEFDNNRTYDVEANNNPDDVMPVTGADNGIMLEKLCGLDYSDLQSLHALLTRSTVYGSRWLAGSYRILCIILERLY